MKKIFFILFFCIISFTAFTDEFSLLPWVCNQKDVYSYCINKGWEYSSNTSSVVPEFSFEPSNNVTYRGNHIYSISFMFDASGNLVSQAITFSELFEAQTTFPVVLDFMIADKASLIDKSVNTGEFVYISYKTKLNKQVSADYVIYGQNNSFQLSIAYHVY